MAPQSVARGVPEAGIGQRRGCQTAPKVHLGRQQPATGSHLPLEDTALPFAVSPDFTATPMGRGFAGGLPCQTPSEGERPRAWPEGPCEARDRAAAGMSRPREEPVEAFASRYGVASSFGRHCSALRGRTIRVVAFRAPHPAKPPSRQQRFVQRFLEQHRLSLRISLFYPPVCSPTPPVGGGDEVG